MNGDIRTGTSVEAIKQSVLDHLCYSQGRTRAGATLNDWYIASALAIRDRLAQRFIRTVDTMFHSDSKSVAYLSAEFLMGPHLENNLINLGIKNEFFTALHDLGIDPQAIIDQEEEPGLGNGGLGRLAACFLESLSTLEVPAIGYGIRYEFGIFDQVIRDGWQVEITDQWLHLGNPWEIHRPEGAVHVKFGGHTESYTDSAGRFRVRWVPRYEVVGEPYDTPVLGYRTNTANLLRLWSARAVESLDFEAFNTGDYMGAVEQKVSSETISKILYPNDETDVGKQLRLAQQYFFTSCSLQDLLRRHVRAHRSIERLHDYSAVQMNDTHPAIAVAELMRLLVDEHGLPWEEAWAITTQTMSYTNHTLLPEALERWPLPMFQALLPRLLEIIYEINSRFLHEVRWRFPGDEERAGRMSIIGEEGPRFVRMAHLASVGSRKINGVAALHSEMLKAGVLRDFHDMSPEKFVNVTNGVTPRRWMLLSNEPLSRLISREIGEGWLRDAQQLRGLEPLAEDAHFRKHWREVKFSAKERLARHILKTTGIEVSPESLFDIQVKRIHEYKRQHLNALYIIARYQRLKRNPELATVPRTVIFGGKAAPGYRLAKLIIKLINSIAEVVNNDPEIGDRLKVVFLPDYNVLFGQRVYPAAELSEQISTAGKEASGTGNMKFALNGSLTIGTLDGANIEIRDEVGAENFFLFGLDAAGVQRTLHGYWPRGIYETNGTVRTALDALSSGAFSRGDYGLFQPLVDNLVHRDPYLVLADFDDYARAQDQVDEAYRDPERWARMSILNTARMGRFSSDRSIREYCEKIWNVRPVPVTL